MTRARDLADGTFANDLTVDTNTLYVDSTNNRVGIGQSSPSAALHILDTSTPQAKIAYDSNRYMNVEHATIYNVSGAAQSNNLKFATRGNSGNNNITFFTGGTDASGTSESERLRISSAGNLQAGATSGRGGASTGHLFKMPSGDIYFEIMGNAAGSNTDILFSDGTGGSYGVVGYDHTNDALRFFANSGERVRINSSGFVGIATTDPQNELDVRGTVEIGNGSTQRMYLQGTGTDFRFYDRANLAERLRIDSSGNVGIGTTSPANTLSLGDVGSFGQDTNTLYVGSNFTGTGINYRKTGNYAVRQFFDSANGVIAFFNAGTGTAGSPISWSRRVDIDASGNLLVGKTTTALGTDGIRLADNDTSNMTVNGGTVLDFNRRTSDGSILGFYKDGSGVGSIGTNGGRVFISGPAAGGIKFDQYGPTNGAPLPCTSTGAKADNLHDFGVSDARWDDIYATNGTIQTSDQNEKNTITDSDLGLDFINRLTPKSYIFNGKSRTHYGLIAQEVEDVLNDIGKPTSGFAGFIKGDISPDRDGSAYR